PAMLRQTWSRYCSSLSIGLLQDAVDGVAQLGPRLHLLPQRRPALLGDVVVAPLAARLLLLPLADDQAVGLQLVQSGVQQPLPAGERPVGVAVHRRGDLVAVHRLAAQQRQDEQRQRALEEFGVHARPQAKGFDTSDSLVLSPAGSRCQEGARNSSLLF